MSVVERISRKLGEMRVPLHNAFSFTERYAPYANVYGCQRDAIAHARYIINEIAPHLRVLESMLELAEKEEATGESGTQEKILGALEKIASGTDGPEILAALKRIEWAMKNRAAAPSPKDGL